MAKNEQIKASELTGNNIYHIKNQTIFYDVFTKNAYIITNDVVPRFSMYQMGVAIALIVSCITGLILQNYFIGFGIGMVVYGIIVILFHIFFFPKLPLSTHFSRPTLEPITIRYAKLMTKGRVVVIAVLAFISTVLMAFNALLAIDNIYYFIANVILTLVCFAVFVLAIITGIKKKKYNL